MQFDGGLVPHPGATSSLPFPPGFEPGASSAASLFGSSRADDVELAALAGNYAGQFVHFARQIILFGDAGSGGDAIRPLLWLAERLGVLTTGMGATFEDRRRARARPWLLYVTWLAATQCELGAETVLSFLLRRCGATLLLAADAGQDGDGAEGASPLTVRFFRPENARAASAIGRRMLLADALVRDDVRLVKRILAEVTADDVLRPSVGDPPVMQQLLKMPCTSCQEGKSVWMLLLQEGSLACLEAFAAAGVVLLHPDGKLPAPLPWDLSRGRPTEFVAAAEKLVCDVRGAYVKALEAARPGTVFPPGFFPDLRDEAVVQIAGDPEALLILFVRQASTIKKVGGALSEAEGGGSASQKKKGTPAPEETALQKILKHAEWCAKQLEILRPAFVTHSNVSDEKLKASDGPLPLPDHAKGRLGEQRPGVSLATWWAATHPSAGSTALLRFLLQRCCATLLLVANCVRGASGSRPLSVVPWRPRFSSDGAVLETAALGPGQRFLLAEALSLDDAELVRVILTEITTDFGLLPACMQLVLRQPAPFDTPRADVAAQVMSPWEFLMKHGSVNCLKSLSDLGVILQRSDTCLLPTSTRDVRRDLPFMNIMNDMLRKARER